MESKQFIAYQTVDSENNEQITKIVDLTLIQQNAVWSVIQYISKMQSKNLNFIIKRDTVMDMIKNELI